MKTRVSLKYFVIDCRYLFEKVYVFKVFLKNASHFYFATMFDYVRFRLQVGLQGQLYQPT